jgi:hypothetical protein
MPHGSLIDDLVAQLVVTLALASAPFSWAGELLIVKEALD